MAVHRLWNSAAETRGAHRVCRAWKRVVLVLDTGSAHTSHRSTAVLAQIQDLVRVIWLADYFSEQFK